jgi:hypothetical protein
VFLLEDARVVEQRAEVATGNEVLRHRDCELRKRRVKREEKGRTMARKTCSGSWKA